MHGTSLKIAGFTVTPIENISGRLLSFEIRDINHSGGLNIEPHEFDRIAQCVDAIKAIYSVLNPPR